VRPPIHDQGRDSRAARVRSGGNGAWGSSSQDFACLARLIFGHSRHYAALVGGNCSPYTLAGIPMLLSALRCLLVEINSGMFGGHEEPGRLSALADTTSDVRVILDHYNVPVELKERLQLLEQVRHEILHPAHRPSGAPGNTPEYLTFMREAGLLESTGKDADLIWLAQLQSHRLFEWAFATVRDAVIIVLDAHEISALAKAGLTESYTRFASTDAA
jgi:hypothetical protein